MFLRTRSWSAIPAASSDTHVSVADASLGTVPARNAAAIMTSLEALIQPTSS
jgi:hypothetical protein